MAKCNVNTQERFADIQMLRYELKGFENLSLTQKIYDFFRLIAPAECNPSLCRDKV